MESYKAIILTFSLRMYFLRVADIERIKSHKEIEYSGRDFSLRPDLGSNRSGMKFQSFR